ncbi:DinB family protein [Gordonia sp. VNQ95]|uniref:DinB family protein n=1 Tax=Gordonia sp. VNQ95 TaxID=3156619 RepID=UPI0032B54EFC
MAGTYTPVTLSVDVTGEKEELLTLLDDQRQVFLVTLRNLDDAQARTRTTVSELTLGGLLKHLTLVERGATETMTVRDEEATFDMSLMEHAYELTDDETLDDWLTAYREAAAAYDAAVAGLDLDDQIPQETAPWQPEREWWSARKMVLHMLRETAHHSGHADIIREALDGQTTMSTLFDFGDAF